MVKSGLEKPREEGQEVNVSPYRLCMHLTSAFVIYSYVMWLALSVLRPAPSATASAAVKAVKKLAHASAGVLGITIVSGTTIIFLLLLTSQPQSPLHALPNTLIQVLLSLATAPACASPNGRLWATLSCRRTCGTLFQRGATYSRTRPPSTSITAAWRTCMRSLIVIM
jgi:heme A synthase